MSDILTRKTNAHFKHLDLNNDGYISLKDFVEMAERHCDTEKTDAAEREKVTGCFAKVSYFRQLFYLIKLSDNSNTGVWRFLLKPQVNLEITQRVDLN